MGCDIGKNQINEGGDVVASISGVFSSRQGPEFPKQVCEYITTGTGVLSPMENTLFLLWKYNIYPIYFYVRSYILKGNMFSIKRVHIKKKGKWRKM